MQEEKADIFPLIQIKIDKYNEILAENAFNKEHALSFR
jgi:hypothetical protein